MRNECRDALSALCDGEVVDPELVREALGDPNAPGLLVAVARTRAELTAEVPEPSRALDDRITSELARFQPARLAAIRRRVGAGGIRGALVGTAAGLVAGWLLGSVPNPAHLALVTPPPPLSARVAPLAVPEATKAALAAIDRPPATLADEQASDRAAPVASRVVTFSGAGTWTEVEAPRDGEVRR